jgi:hypothetical protein
MILLLVKVLRKKLRSINCTAEFELELESSDDESPDLDLDSGPLIPPESADVLVIGKDKLIERIITYLQQKRHKGTLCFYFSNLLKLPT